MKKKISTMICMALVSVMMLNCTACGSDKDSAPEGGNGEYNSGDMTEDNSPADEGQPSEGETSGDDFWDENVNLDEGMDEGFEEPIEWSDEMQAIRDAVTAELGEDYYPGMQMPADYLSGTYGVTPDLYDDYFGEMPSNSFNIDTLVVVKAKDGQADAVESALNEYRQNLINSLQPYPVNTGKAQAVKVARIDNYVCLVLLGGDTMKEDEEGDEAVMAHCVADNERVIAIISEQIKK